MNEYEKMSREELISLLWLQGRIINSLTRELKGSTTSLRNRQLQRKSAAHGKAISEGRMECLTPERRREIARIAVAARWAKKKAPEPEPV